MGAEEGGWYFWVLFAALPVFAQWFNTALLGLLDGGHESPTEFPPSLSGKPTSQEDEHGEWRFSWWNHSASQVSLSYLMSGVCISQAPPSRNGVYIAWCPQGSVLRSRTCCSSKPKLEETSEAQSAFIPPNSISSTRATSDKCSPHLQLKTFQGWQFEHLTSPLHGHPHCWEVVS